MLASSAGTAGLSGGRDSPGPLPLSRRSVVACAGGTPGSGGARRCCQYSRLAAEDATGVAVVAEVPAGAGVRGDAAVGAVAVDDGVLVHVDDDVGDFRAVLAEDVQQVARSEGLVWGEHASGRRWAIGLILHVAGEADAQPVVVDPGGEVRAV